MKISTLSELAEESVSHNPEIKKKVMLRKGDLLHITNFSQAVFAPGQTAVIHPHHRRISRLIPDIQSAI